MPTRHSPVKQCVKSSTKSSVITSYSIHYTKLYEMSGDEIRAVIGKLHARIDWLTIDGSLNQELTVQNY